MSTRLPVFHARLPAPLLEALDRVAEREHAGNRSAAIKALLIEGLSRRGLSPPPAVQAR